MGPPPDLPRLVLLLFCFVQPLLISGKKPTPQGAASTPTAGSQAFTTTSTNESRSQKGGAGPPKGQDGCGAGWGFEPSTTGQN